MQNATSANCGLQRFGLWWQFQLLPLQSLLFFSTAIVFHRTPHILNISDTFISPVQGYYTVSVSVVLPLLVSTCLSCYKG